MCDETRDLLATLHFIAKIQEGEKLDTKYRTLYQDTLTLKLYRTIFRGGNESRDTTYKFISETIDKALDLSKKYLKSTVPYDVSIGCTIIDGIINAKSGINEIKKTYTGDQNFISKIEALLDILELKLNEIKKELRMVT